MITADDVLTELREWIGTPVIPSGAIKGVGCNCIGMAGGAALNLGLNQLWDAFTPYQGQAEPPAKRFLLRALLRHLQKIPQKEMNRACLLLLRENPDDATHVAIVSRCNASSITVIEAIAPRVTEHRLASSRQIIAAFKIPGVNYE